jgi:anti-sigma-K factor RskA
MKHNVATDETREQAALYALGALSQIEARAFEVHIREGCSICEADLQGFDGVVCVLGMQPAEASPPIYLRDLLVARIQKERPPIAQDGEDSAAGAARPGIVTSDRSTGSRVVMPWAIAAALAVVALASLYAWRRADERSRLQAGQMAGLVAQYDRLESQLDHLDKKNAEQGAMLRVMGSPGAKMIPLTPQGSFNAGGELVCDTLGRQWVVSATLPAAPPGKVYQLWFVTPTAPKSAGLLETDAAGHGFKILTLSPDVGPVNAAAVTLEPEGGSEKPTLPIYVVGKMS